MNWQKDLKGKVLLNAPLKKYSTFRIGGPAKFLIAPKDAGDLRHCLNLLNFQRIEFLIIGAGSNILINDKGIKKAVLRLNSPFFKRIYLKGNSLKAGAGALLSKVILFSKENNLSSIEFLSGIPGTIGGALVMNAGAFGKSIGDLVKNVTVMDYQGNISKLEKKYIKFGYRRSGLLDYIILSVSLKVTHKKRKEIEGSIKKCIGLRKATQDYSYPSLGCIFRNPSTFGAGRLIDLSGLKGKRIGGARVSLKHANFILNVENAQAQDVLQLMALIKQRVRNKFNINLEPEIKIWK